MHGIQLFPTIKSWKQKSEVFRHFELIFLWKKLLNLGSLAWQQHEKQNKMCMFFIHIFLCSCWLLTKSEVYPWSKLNAHTHIHARTSTTESRIRAHTHTHTYTHRGSMHHGNWLTLPTSCMSCSCLSCDRVWCLRASWRAVSPSLSAMFRLQPSRTNSWTKNKQKKTKNI